MMERSVSVKKALTQIIGIMYFTYCVFGFAKTNSSGINSKVTIGGNAIEKYDDGKSIKYRFLSKNTQDLKTKELFSTVLNQMLSSSTNPEINILAQYLPIEKMRRKYLEEVFSVCDSKVWADGNSYAAYDILLSKESGLYGYKLADLAIQKNARNANIDRLDILLIIEFVSVCRPLSHPTLVALAGCLMKNQTTYSSVLAVSVGLAKIGRPKDGLNLVKSVEEKSKGEDNISDRCKTIIGLINDLPSTSDLYKKLEGALL